MCGFSAQEKVDQKEAAQWKHRPEIGPRSKSVIEVLREEPRYMYSTTPDRSQIRPDKLQQSLAEVSGFSDAVEGADVHRIRIRSKPLPKATKDATGCNTVIGPHEHRLQDIESARLTGS